ncbi:OmpA family protein [Sphingomonas abietis]|uniref:OmpA family protein n=1 Tax=Sphingomonas abietis TaxID=3012344 RepID=A0ABY7NN25_9SPHN|nr:OmpA family protein [Sphingomonas abietis]WBO22930.1 OmpA family protein [Sphingomonas abietis]
MQPPAPVPPTPLPTVITIPFDKPGVALDDAQLALLKPLIARLSATTDGIVIRGHTDSHGGDRRNRFVSLRRARLVATYLAGQGIARGRMTLVGLGEDRPIAPNAMPDGSDDPVGRARNRRVEIEIVPIDEAAGKPSGPIGPGKP